MADAMKLYRKTALVSAEQFLPSEGKIPEGVFSDGLADPRKSTAEWCLQTLEGRHTLRNGDYICTGPNGEKWNVEQSIFEATYEPASPPAREEAPDEGAGDSTMPPPHWTDDDRYDRHPKAADDWNWRNDPPLSEGGLDLAVRRLNFAGDRADPRAPDQMALVLRKDLINIKHELIRQRALAALRNRTSEPEAGAVAWRWHHKTAPGNWRLQSTPFYIVKGSGPITDYVIQPLYRHPAPATADKPSCPACYRGEVFGLSMDDGFWVEISSSAGGANEHGMNGWLELMEHHPDGTTVTREYVAKDSPLFVQPATADKLLVAVEALEKIVNVDAGGGFLGAFACRQVAAEALTTLAALNEGGN